MIFINPDKIIIDNYFSEIPNKKISLPANEIPLFFQSFINTDSTGLGSMNKNKFVFVADDIQFLKSPGLSVAI